MFGLANASLSAIIFSLIFLSINDSAGMLEVLVKRWVTNRDATAEVRARFAETTGLCINRLLLGVCDRAVRELLNW